MQQRAVAADRNDEIRARYELALRDVNGARYLFGWRRGVGGKDVDSALTQVGDHLCGRVRYAAFA